MKVLKHKLVYSHGLCKPSGFKSQQWEQGKRSSELAENCKTTEGKKAANGRHSERTSCTSKYKIAVILQCSSARNDLHSSCEFMIKYYADFERKLKFSQPLRTEDQQNNDICSKAFEAMGKIRTRKGIHRGQGEILEYTSSVKTGVRCQGKSKETISR